MFAEDLTVFFPDFGVPAVWTPSGGGEQQTATVLFDNPDEFVFGEQLAISKVAEITYAKGQLVGLDEDEVLTVDGVSYRVRERPKSIDDGRLMKALISRA